jgi:hypothetical protein
MLPLSKDYTFLGEGSYASAALCGMVSLSSRSRSITSYTSKSTWHWFSDAILSIDTKKVPEKARLHFPSLVVTFFICAMRIILLFYLNLQVRIKRNTGLIF